MCYEISLSQPAPSPIASVNLCHWLGTPAIAKRPRRPGGVGSIQQPWLDIVCPCVTCFPTQMIQKLTFGTGKPGGIITPLFWAKLLKSVHALQGFFLLGFFSEAVLLVCSMGAAILKLMMKHLKLLRQLRYWLKVNIAQLAQINAFAPANVGITHNARLHQTKSTPIGFHRAVFGEVAYNYIA